MAMKHPHLKGGGVSCFDVASSFLSLPFSAIVVLLSLCSFTYSGLEMADIYVYIYICMLENY